MSVPQDQCVPARSHDANPPKDVGRACRTEIDPACRVDDAVTGQARASARGPSRLERDRTRHRLAGTAPCRDLPALPLILFVVVTALQVTSSMFPAGPRAPGSPAGPEEPAAPVAPVAPAGPTAPVDTVDDAEPLTVFPNTVLLAPSDTIVPPLAV